MVNLNEDNVTYISKVAATLPWHPNDLRPASYSVLPQDLLTH